MNRTSIARFAALVVLATAFAPQVAVAQRPDEIAIRAALNARMTDFAQALRAKDAAAVANMFTEDATWVMPDASAFAGRTAITAAATRHFQTFESLVIDQMSIDRLIVVSDSMAVAFAHADYTVTETGKPPVKRVNPVADLWLKGADGVWRVSYELNADGPAPGPSAASSAP